MEDILKFLSQKFCDQADWAEENLSAFVLKVSDVYEEERRKQKCQADLSDRIAAVNLQFASVEAEEARTVEEKKKVHQKHSDLNAQLKRESKKVDDMQVAISNDRAKIEEYNRATREIQDRASILLKPYHEFMGFTMTITSSPEEAIRFLFQMPSGKKCMVKIIRKNFNIVKCVPMLQDLSSLEAKLRETHDFPGFITRLRTLLFKSAKAGK